jgi:hypothetical protein
MVFFPSFSLLDSRMFRSFLFINSLFFLFTLGLGTSCTPLEGPQPLVQERQKCQIGIKSMSVVKTHFLMFNYFAFKAARPTIKSLILSRTSGETPIKSKQCVSPTHPSTRIHWVKYRNLFLSVKKFIGVN